MARATDKLNQKAINGLKYIGRPRYVSVGGVPGLEISIGLHKKAYSLRYRASDGRMQRHSIGDAAVLTVDEARKKALDALNQKEHGVDVHKAAKEKAAPKLTLGQYVSDIYIPERRPSKHTIWRLTSQFKDVFFSRPVEELTASDLMRWRNNRIDSGVKAATCNKDIGSLKAAIQWGVDSGALSENPLFKLKRLPEEGISEEADSKEIIRFLSDEEKERLYGALAARDERIKSLAASTGKPIDGPYGDYMTPMILISLNSGLRRGSLFGLTWEDVDFDLGLITLRASNVKSKRKTILPMSAITRSALEKWHKQTGDTSGLIFKSKVTDGMLWDVKKSWANILKAAKIENFRWHDMRHSFASDLVRRGVDLFKVQKLMGHSDISMTQRYSHLRPSDLQDAIAVLDIEPGKIIGKITASA